jgi:hypothetical protein
MEHCSEGVTTAAVTPKFIEETAPVNLTPRNLL